MELSNHKSSEAFEEAIKLLPGGVNSPVRAFKSIGGTPLFMARGKGPYIWDIDGNRFIDYCMSWGALLLGHAHKDVLKSLRAVLGNGTSFGCPTIAETTLAKLIIDAIPSIEKIRFVNSGTEATMSAVRLARAYTTRNIIVKFDGCYHGHSDAFLVAAGSGLAHSSGASSRGVPEEVIRNTVSLPFNDSKALETFFNSKGNLVASIILEIVPANMGLKLPDPNFLETISRLSLQSGCLIIADEVITGFRFPVGSAQQQYGFTPHLTTLGKIIGGGFPVGAYGGKQEIMASIAPEGDVYQAGTLSGNPVAMTAGIATLSELNKAKTVQKLIRNTEHLSDNLRTIAARYNVTLNSAGSMFTLFLTKQPVRNFEDVKKHADSGRFAKFYHALLQSGIYLSPSAFETNFLSAAHTGETIDYTCEAVERALK